MNDTGMKLEYTVYCHVMNIKCLAVVLCKGTPKQKAAGLFEATTGMMNLKAKMKSCEQDSMAAKLAS
jgi:hypothetical protein